MLYIMPISGKMHPLRCLTKLSVTFSRCSTGIAETIVITVSLSFLGTYLVLQIHQKVEVQGVKIRLVGVPGVHCAAIGDSLLKMDPQPLKNSSCSVWAILLKILTCSKIRSNNAPASSPKPDHGLQVATRAGRYRVFISSHEEIRLDAMATHGALRLMTFKSWTFLSYTSFGFAEAETIVFIIDLIV